MSIPAGRTLSVSRVADRLKTSSDTICRLLESGQLRGYRLSPRGWWRVLENSLLEYENELLLQATEGKE